MALVCTSVCFLISSGLSQEWQHQSHHLYKVFMLLICRKMNLCTHTYTCTHMHTHICTHARMHTHTHTHFLSNSNWISFVPYKHISINFLQLIIKICQDLASASATIVR